MSGMATNLRLRPEAEEALRAEAARSGRSQQELLREAVDHYLALDRPPRPISDAERLMADGLIRPPRDEYRTVPPNRPLPTGMSSSLELLDRDDRV